MDSFEAKIGWRKMRKIENKNYLSVPFLSYQTRNRKFQKNFQQHSKNKKIPLWLHLKLKQVEKGREREKIKIIVLFRSYPKRNRKFQKKRKKIQKIKKYHHGFI